MKLLLLLFVISLSACSSLKILAMLPFNMRSHQIVFNKLLAELVRKGHQVTVYSGTALNSNASNYRHVPVATSLDKLEERFTFENIKSRIDLEAFIRPMGFQLFTSNLSDEVLSLPQVRDLLDSNEEFDVVILETFFGQEALIGFGHRFNAPVVTLSSFGTWSLPDNIMGNPNPLAYFTTYQLAYTSDLTFYQKLKNVVATLSELHYSYYHHLPKQQQTLDKHFQKYAKSSPLPSLMDLLTNIAVVLLNTQPEMSYARPWVPNMISVGGLHIPSKISPLPKDIQKFIDGSDDGFLYFSLGSTFSGASIPAYIKEAFITAFRKIPQRVLWKIDSPPSDIPPNVKTIQWAKQIDVLAHPKCRAFITHGGLLSLLEATHFAVPLIGLPMFADQPWNIVQAEHAQTGVRLAVLSITADSVSKALQEVLHNPKYKRNMVQLSGQMRDKLVSPLDTAVYWVEYVAKHQGAPQLRSPGRNMSSYHYLLLDIVLLVTSSVLFILFVLYISFKYIKSLFCNSNAIKKAKSE